MTSLKPNCPYFEIPHLMSSLGNTFSTLLRESKSKSRKEGHQELTFPSRTMSSKFKLKTRRFPYLHVVKCLTLPSLHLIHITFVEEFLRYMNALT